jgi:ABC-type branched-subunit amino acid transport system substrate-binding protein
MKMLNDDDDTQVYKRPLVELTDEDIQPIVQKAMVYYGYDSTNPTLTSGAGFYALAQAIEAALRRKNG